MRYNRLINNIIKQDYKQNDGKKHGTCIFRKSKRLLTGFENREQINTQSNRMGVWRRM